MPGFVLNNAPITKEQAKMLFLYKLKLEQEISKIDEALAGAQTEVLASSIFELQTEGKISPKLEQEEEQK